MKKLDLTAANEVFRSYLQGSGYASTTVKQRLVNLKVFYQFLTKQKGKEDFRDVQRSDLIDYIKYLREHVSSKTGKPYKNQSQRWLFSGVKQAFSCFYIMDLILVNPAHDVEVGLKKDKGERKIFLNFIPYFSLSKFFEN